MKTYVLIAMIAYLCGSIPFGYLLVRIFLGEDVRQTGSGNIGATNVARTGSKGLAAATLALDAAKGIAAVLFAKVLAHAAETALLDVKLAMAIGALFVILGHLYPVWLKFKGGKGVAAALGAFIGQAPLPVAIVLVLFIIIVAVFHYISLGSIVASAAFPFVVLLIDRGRISAITFAIMCISSLLIIWRHRQNIQRLRAGTENRFPSSKPSEGHA